MTNSLLTDDQRKYLQATDGDRRRDYSKQQRHYHRTNLPERIRQGVEDFSVLFEDFPDSLLRETFEGSGDSLLDGVSEGRVDPKGPGGFIDSEDPPTRMDPELEEGMIDAVAFLWKAGEASLLDPQDLFETGIRQAYEESYPDRIANPTVDPNDDDRRQVAINAWRKILNRSPPDELSDREVRAIVAEDLIPPWVDLGEYLRDGLDALPPEFSDDELEEALGDAYTVQDGTINYGEAPVELDDSMVEAVTETLLDSDMDDLADRWVQKNDHTDAPVRAETIRRFVLSLDVEKMANQAGVSPDEFQEVLAQYADEIEASLAAEYDNIENQVDVLSGATAETDDE